MEGTAAMVNETRRISQNGIDPCTYAKIEDVTAPLWPGTDRVQMPSTLDANVSGSFNGRRKQTMASDAV